MSFFKKLWSEDTDKKWYQHKAVLYSAGVIIVGIAGYLDPSFVSSVDLSQYQQLTWAGVGGLILSLLKHSRTKK